jgi:hypothetical protein
MAYGDYFGRAVDDSMDRFAQSHLVENSVGRIARIDVTLGVTR